MRPRVARACSRVRVSPPPARVCGRRLRLRICTRVSPAHYARVCMRGRAPTHPLPPPPMGVGVASKHQAPSQEPTFTLYYLRKSAPKKLKTHFPIFYNGRMGFLLLPSASGSKESEKAKRLRTLFPQSPIQPIAADANRNTDENMSLNVSKSQW